MNATLLLFLSIYIPALVANGSPTLIRKGHPVDLGAKFLDGRRILGDGKTFEGFTLGVLYATSVALTLANLLGEPLIAYYGAVAGVGALLGDMTGSFVKRRLGVERGEPLPLLDQLDFLLGAYLATSAAGYTPPLHYAAALAVIVYVLHRATNIAAYKLGIKPVPW